MIPVLRKKFAKSKIIALHIDNSFPERDVPFSRGVESEKVQMFLEKELMGIDAQAIRVIEWRPSMNRYGEEYLKLLKIVVDFIKREDAGKRTTAAFGKRWLRNFFRNLGIINSLVLYKTTDIPVIVTGAGPSLETAIPAIKGFKERGVIIAASSSIMALARDGVSADIVIATDGGGWAPRHIYPLFQGETRGQNGEHPLLAFDPRAAIPSQCETLPFLVLNDGSLWQNIILGALDIPSVIIGQRGTVTASAIELALLLSGGNIFLAGMDLAVRDIRTHARPYGFDFLSRDSASRFSPAYSKSFTRALMSREGGSMEIYASWFKSQIAVWPKRIFSLGENHEIFEKSIPAKEIKQKKKDYFKVIDVNRKNASLKRAGFTALRAAMKDPKYAPALNLELAALLFPYKSDATAKELETAVAEAARE